MSVNTLAIPQIVVAYLTTYFLHSTILLGLTYIVLRFSRIQSPALTERLWKMAAVVGLMTPALQLASGFSQPIVDFPLGGQHVFDGSDQAGHRQNAARFEDRRTGADAAAIESGSQISAGLRPPISGNASGSRADRQNGEPTPQRACSAAGGAFHATWFFDRAFEAALICFTIVLMAGVVRMACQTCSFGRRLARCRLLSDGRVRSLLDDLQRQCGVKRSVSLLVSASYPEPVAFGIWKWRIVVPQGIERRLSQDELKALLAHELAHLVRGDPVWLWFGRALCSCFAFQPLNFVARKRWRRAAEFACDDWAVLNAANPLALARCLTQVAEWRLNIPKCAVTLAAGGAQSNITERVERLVADRQERDPWRSRRRRLLVAVPLGALAVGLAVWGPRTTLRADQPASESNTVIRLASVPRLESQPENEAIEMNRPPEEFTSEFAALERELQQLESAVNHLNRLASRSDVDAETMDLTRNISQRLESLKRQHSVVRAMHGHLHELMHAHRHRH